MKEKIFIEVRRLFAVAECRCATEKALKIFRDCKPEAQLLRNSDEVSGLLYSRIEQTYNGKETPHSLGITAVFGEDDPFNEFARKKLGIQIIPDMSINNIVDIVWKTRRNRLINHLTKMVQDWNISVNDIFPDGK